MMAQDTRPAYCLGRLFLFRELINFRIKMLNRTILTLSPQPLQNKFADEVWVKQSALYILSLPQGRLGHLSQPPGGREGTGAKGATVSDPAAFSSSSHLEH